jgi:hypothetical protein
MAKQYVWVLYDQNKPIGRIAAFYDKEIAKNSEQPTGGIGFFECINSSRLPTNCSMLPKNG